MKPDTKIKFKSAEDSPQQAGSRKSSNSSSSDEEKQVQLQKMLSQSINSYSLEKAYSSAGLESPKNKKNS